MASKKVRSLDFFTYARRAPDSGYGILLRQWESAEYEAEFARREAAKYAGKSEVITNFYEGRESASRLAAIRIAEALGLAEWWSPGISRAAAALKGGAS